MELALERLINETVAEIKGQCHKEIGEKISVIQDLSKMVSELKKETSSLKTESKQYQDQIINLSGELKTVKISLGETTNQIANRLIGVENTFTTSFTVDGSTHFYYPVAIAVHDQGLIRSRLGYEIYR